MHNLASSCAPGLIGTAPRLLQDPGDAGFLWRLARTLVHLSMHLEQRGETEEEKQLLQQGWPPSHWVVVSCIIMLIFLLT